MKSAEHQKDSPNNNKFSSQEWLINQAVQKHKEEKNEEAIAFYSEVINLDSNQPAWIYSNIISLMTNLDFVKEATHLSKKALEIHPSSDEIHRSLGMMFDKKQDTEQSIQEYSQAIELVPNQPEWVFVNLSKLLLQKKSQLNKALEVCNLGLKHHSSSKYLRQFKIKILIAQGKWNQAQTILAKNFSDNDDFERITSDSAFKVNEYIVYFEFNYQGSWSLQQLKLLSLDNLDEAIPKTHWFVYSNNCIACIFIFDLPIDFNKLTVFTVSPDRQAIVEIILAETSAGLELVHYVSSKSNYAKCILKENIIRGIVENTKTSLIDYSQKSIKKLQSFIQISPQLCNNIQEPFSIYFDKIIPIQCEGLFLEGWMSDPFDMLEEITAISCLGFSISFKDYIYYLDRPDISEIIANTPYKGIKKRLGIMAYIPFTSEIKKVFQPYAQQYNFRFSIKLQGNITKEFIPPASYFNSSYAMANLLKSCTTHKTNTSLLNNCLAPAILAINKTTTSECVQIEVKDIGKNTIKTPLASIIIPISKSIDLFKIQFATLVNDDSVRNSELIYILSSFDKQDNWRKIIETYSSIYNFPVKLILLEAEENYAKSINVATAKSKSNICILLCSDVLPKTENWVTKMVNFYQNLAKPGVVTPKLIYEDLSIQHAGTSYEKIDANTWNYKYFYQGLSSNYPLAKKNYKVPGVNGACMMFSRQLHQQVKGLSESYIISECEAADFCFKSTKLGCENWYFSEVEMYFFEKQNHSTQLIECHSLNMLSKTWSHLMNAAK